MQCSIERSVAVSLPTCIDYATLANPPVAVGLDLPTRRFFPRAIAEDEETGRMHVLHTMGSKVLVLSYDGRVLFEYTIEGLPQFKPRGMCIRNNLVYITDLRYNRLYLFTLEGELVSYVQTNKSPRGVAADGDNNVYVCFREELQVFNCTLPVHRTFGRSRIGCPKDVQLREEAILVLSWAPCATVFALSAEGSVLSRVAMGTNSSVKPWYFDLDSYGNYVLVFSINRVGVVELRSQEGKLIASQRLKQLERPRGIKLLKNKTMLALTSYGQIHLSLF